MHMIAILTKVNSVVLCFLNHNLHTQVSAVEGLGRGELAEGSSLVTHLFPVHCLQKVPLIRSLQAARDCAGSG